MGDKLRLLCIKRPLYDVNFVSDALCLEDAPYDNWSKKIGISKKERKHLFRFLLVEKGFAMFAHCIFSNVEKLMMTKQWPWTSRLLNYE